MNLRDVDRSLVMLARFVESEDGRRMNLGQLRNALRAASEAAESAANAADWLDSGAELADTFPNGDLAPTVPSPRQVIYLARQLRPIETTRPGPPPKRCSSIKPDSERCRSYALLGTNHCRSHASLAERKAGEAHRAEVDAEYQRRSREYQAARLG